MTRPEAGLEPLLERAGELAAEALGAWAKTVTWTHELKLLSGSFQAVCATVASHDRSVGMDTHGELAGTFVLHGRAEALTSASDLIAGAERSDAATLEIANVLGSAYLNVLRDQSGVVSDDPRTFLPSPPGWHQVPVTVVYHLAACGQGTPDSVTVAQHHFRCRTTTIHLSWIPSFIALDSLRSVGDQTEAELVGSPTPVDEPISALAGR